MRSKPSAEPDVLRPRKQHKKSPAFAGLFMFGGEGGIRTLFSGPRSFTFLHNSTAYRFSLSLSCTFKPVVFDIFSTPSSIA